MADRGQADIYQNLLVPAIFAPWAKKLLRVADLRPGERVLDLACGTGAVSRLAAERVGAEGRVLGVDVDPSMLGVARSLPSPEGATIEYREGDAADLPADDASVDIVVCQQGIQFFPDRAGMLREARRVLVPGGRVAFSVWRGSNFSPAFQAVIRAVEDHIGPDAAAARRRPMSFGDVAPFRVLLDEAGMVNAVVRIEVGLARFPSIEALVKSQSGIWGLPET
ncbi:MAG TPA: methyltransferase domain-containing protein, partial [Dehalococcoidia bacterium]